MTYRVRYAQSFYDDVDRQVVYLLEQQVALSTIEHWFNALYAKLDSLEQMPRRYAIDEHQSAEFGREIHKLIVGDYLVLFAIEDDMAVVDVITFMHGARERLS